MNAWYFAAAALLAIAAAGCRTNISQDLLEQELRMQEDKIYELQGLVDEYETRLESCARENKTLIKESVAAPTQVESRPARGEMRDEEFSLPEVEVPGEPAPPYDGPPLISPPDPNVPEGEMAPEEESGPPYNMRLPRSGATPGDRSQLPDFELPAGEESPVDDKTAADETVTQITLNRKLTGGHNADGEPGDDGLMVVVEPLDAGGQLQEIPGEVSVVVLDPAKEGEAARVARWDFTAAESAAHLKRTPMGDGLHFELRWPHGPPDHRELNLYVRYITPEGKRLQVEKKIEVDVPGLPEAEAEPSWTKVDKPAGSSTADRSTQNWSDSPRAKATAVRPAADDDAPKSGAKPDKNGRTAAPTWAPYR